MIELPNYHKQSMKIEDNYSSDLLIPFSALFNQLNSINDLTKDKINQTTAIWKLENNYDIKNINGEYVEKADALASSLIPPRSVFANQRKADQLAVANDEMLNITTEYIRQKFIELSVLEQNYHYNEHQINEFLKSIVNSTEDKIVLFATMSTSQNVREFLFQNAVNNAYEEYMWETQRDRRVRPTHAYMDKRWVRIDQAPRETGYYHVGQDYNCRCYARYFR